MTYTEALQLFGTTPQELEKLIAISLERGGDYADIFFEYTITNELSLDDEKVNAAGKHIDYGVGIRVINGEQSGYAYSEITTFEEMKKAARFAARIADERGVAIPPLDVKVLEGNSFYPILKGWEESDISDKKPFLESLCRKVANCEKRAVKINAAINDSCSDILFFNSNGETYAERRPMVSVICGCTLEENGKLEQVSASRSFRAGFEILTDEMIGQIADSIKEKSRTLFEARQPKGGEMSVVMGSGSSGILLHEAVGHAFEADFARKNISIFSDSLGRKICDENINIVDDGTVMHNRGSLNYDDEGVPGEKTWLVRKGILNSFMHDRISARYYDTAPTGNGRRESFRFMPLPRMRATYMENGNYEPEEIVASVKKGIYVDNFTNGQVQIGAGDFTFYVKSGYTIENGKLCMPIKDINIIGNGPKALQGIMMVGNDSEIDNSTWTCGKGQSCPVSCGMPTVLVNNLIVGGESDE